MDRAAGPSQPGVSVGGADLRGSDWPRHFLLGMRLDYLGADEFTRLMIDRAEDRQAGYCCVPNVHQCVLTVDDPMHRAIVNAADFVISDSVVLEKSRALRARVPMKETIRGSEIMLSVGPQRS